MTVLSICIGTRDRAHFLRRHLEHLRSFGKIDFEVVVSDNCSGDDTPEVAAEYAKLLPKLHYVRQQEPLNRFETQSAVCAQAAGDFMIFMGDDDFALEEGLMTACAAMAADERVSAVYGPWQSVNGETREVLGTHQNFPESRLYSLNDIGQLADAAWWFELPVFRRAAYHRTHMPVLRYPPFDFHALPLFLRRGLIRTVTEPLLQVAQHPGQGSREIYHADELMYGHVMDLECFGGHVRAMGGEGIEAFVTKKLGRQYIYAAKCALRDGKLAAARELTLRALVYDAPESRLLASELDKKMAGPLVAEALGQAIRVSPPVERVVIEDTGNGRAMAGLLGERHPDLEIEMAAFDAFVTRDLVETEFLVADGQDTAEKRHGHLGERQRKLRSIQDLGAACRIIG